MIKIMSMSHSINRVGGFAGHSRIEIRDSKIPHNVSTIRGLKRKRNDEHNLINGFVLHLRHIEEKHCFYNLFSITSAPSLPALTLQWVLEFNVRPKNYVFHPKTIASYRSFDVSERFAEISAPGQLI